MRYKLFALLVIFCALFTFSSVSSAYLIEQAPTTYAAAAIKNHSLRFLGIASPRIMEKYEALLVNRLIPSYVGMVRLSATGAETTTTSEINGLLTGLNISTSQVRWSEGPLNEEKLLFIAKDTSKKIIDLAKDDLTRLRLYLCLSKDVEGLPNHLIRNGLMNFQAVHARFNRPKMNYTEEYAFPTMMLSGMLPQSADHQPGFSLPNTTVRVFEPVEEELEAAALPASEYLEASIMLLTNFLEVTNPSNEYLGQSSSLLEADLSRMASTFRLEQIRALAQSGRDLSSAELDYYARVLTAKEAKFFEKAAADYANGVAVQSPLTVESEQLTNFYRANYAEVSNIVRNSPYAMAWAYRNIPRDSIDSLQPQLVAGRMALRELANRFGISPVKPEIEGTIPWWETVAEKAGQIIALKPEPSIVPVLSKGEF